MKPEVQEKYMELQMLAQQIKQGQAHVEILEEQLQELMKTKHSIQELVKGRTEGFFPISRGVFVKAKVDNNQELLVNIGANVAVKKSSEESLKLVEKQIVEIREYQQEMIATVQEQEMNAKKMQTEVQSMMK